MQHAHARRPDAYRRCKAETNWLIEVGCPRPRDVSAASRLPDNPCVCGRRGVTTVELALTLPVLFFMFFSALEFSRANMIRHSAQTAAYEGARRGVFPGATVNDVQAAANAILTAASAKNTTVTVNPDPITKETAQVTVTVSIPLDDNGWVVPKFFKGRTLSGSMKLSRERTDVLNF